MSETLIWRPPLALRPVDARTGAPVLDGLVARAWDPRTPDRVFRAISGPSGLLSWHRISGLEAWSDGRSTSVTSTTLHVELCDTARRYLPTRFAAQAPLPDLLTWPLSGGDPWIPLFASATVSTPAGHAAIRATLWDAERGAPASWARLTVTVTTPSGPVLASALADANGSATVFVPWPEPRLTSPATPLANQTWPVSVSVRFSRMSPAFSEISNTLTGEPTPPDLADVDAQGPGALWSDASAIVPFPAASLHFGRELILKSPSAAPGQAVLLVTPSP